MVKEAMQYWATIAKKFGEDGRRFLDDDILASVYEEKLKGYSSQDIEKAIRILLAENTHKMPAANQIKEKITGISCDPRKRAVEGAERIWGAIGSIGGYNAERAKKYLSEEEWEVVRLRGGWTSVCDVTYAQQTAFMAQVRELLVSLYERTSTGLPARLELKPGQESLLSLPPVEENFDGDY